MSERTPEDLAHEQQIEQIHRELIEAEQEIKKKALLRIPTRNDCKFKNPLMQRFSDIWFLQRTTASKIQKDKIAYAFVSKALNLGNRIAKKFFEGTKTGDRRTFFQVGHARFEKKDLNLKSFWEEIRSIFPEFYTQEHVDFLSKLSLEAVMHLLYQIDPPLAEDSEAMAFIHYNENHYVGPHLEGRSKRPRLHDILKVKPK